MTLWSDGEIAQVHAMRAEGLGYSHIARRLRRSKDGVVGKMWRLRQTAPREARVSEPPALCYDKQVNLRVESDLFDALTERAKRDGVARSVLIRDYLEWALEEFE